jgi:murein L,D-transpeptidase YafK
MRYVPLLVAFGILSASLAMAAPPSVRPLAGKVDRILVLKHQRLLLLMGGQAILHSYPVALGLHPVGPKLWEGDSKTPEGNYVVDGRVPGSRYHLALHLSYPGPSDLARAQAAHRPVGGAIMIHGMPNWYSEITMRMAPDWTSGCIAVSNDAIEEIWNAVEDGTPIEIRP